MLAGPPRVLELRSACGDCREASRAGLQIDRRYADKGDSCHDAGSDRLYGHMLIVTVATNRQARCTVPGPVPGREADLARRRERKDGEVQSVTRGLAWL